MRLIDADKLIEDLKESYDDCDIQKSLEFFGIYEFIKEQPTAYNVDKVVEQLEKQVDTNLNEWKKSNWTGEATRPYLLAQKAYVKAINIVEAGGIDNVHK